PISSARWQVASAHPRVRRHGRPMKATPLPPGSTAFIGVTTRLIPMPVRSVTDRLLDPLQANLGYYGGSVTLQVRVLRPRTSVGDPAFTIWQSCGVGGFPVRPFNPAHCGHVGRAGTMVVGHLHDHAVPRQRSNGPALPSTIRP